VHTTPEEFENAALFLQLGLPSTIIRYENGAFRKSSSNRRNLKTPALRFRMDGKRFDKGASRKKMASPKSWNFPDRGFLKYKLKITGDSSIYKFLALWTENI